MFSRTHVDLNASVRTDEQDSVAGYRKHVTHYETKNQNGKLLLVLLAAADEAERARNVLQSASVTTSIHAEPALVSVQTE